MNPSKLTNNDSKDSYPVWWTTTYSAPTHILFNGELEIERAMLLPRLIRHCQTKHCSWTWRKIWLRLNFRWILALVWLGWTDQLGEQGFSLSLAAIVLLFMWGCSCFQKPSVVSSIQPLHYLMIALRLTGPFHLFPRSIHHHQTQHHIELEKNLVKILLKLSDCSCWDGVNRKHILNLALCVLTAHYQCIVTNQLLVGRYGIVKLWFSTSRLTVNAGSLHLIT